MGVLDKLKNALFEVEYVEVEEPEKKKKPEKQSVFEKVKAKTEARDNKKEEKPIAKKIVLPGRKEEKIEELEEEELKDEDFEFRPKDETIKKEKESFKFMDDADFEMDDYVPGEAEILNVIEEKEDRAYEEEIEVRKEEIKDYYKGEASNKNKVTSPYGLDNSYSVPMHEYGTYEKYEERTYFKPSPIISPIYGILDKNYKKEDVKEKTEVRLSSYSRGNVSVDDIRNKAYGSRKNEKVKEEENIKFEVEEEEDNLAVDLSEETKPEVKEITVGDAEEYFEDLGLEYNVDYVDASAEKKTKKDSNKPEVKVESEKDEVEVEEEEKSIDIPEIEEEQDIKEDSNDENEDNLFDLIDSMYQEDTEEGE